MKITRELLKKHAACAEQVATFAAEWPDGTDVTPKSAQRAVALGLDLAWAVANLLPATAQRAYYKAIAPAQRAYNEAIATARRAYNEATAPAQRAYYEATAPAFAAACGEVDS